MRQTVEESHAYIEQHLQRQGAFRKDKQRFQAVDLPINTAISKFVRDSVKPVNNTDRFEINESRRQDIQSIITLNKELTLIEYDGNISYSANLPPDFKYLINDRTILVEDCETEFTNSSETIIERYICFDFANSQAASGDMYKNINIIIDTTSYPITTVGFTSVKDKVYLISVIINEFKNQGIDIYWETYKNVFTPSSFILPTTNLTKVFKIFVDSVELVKKNIDKTITKTKNILTNTINAVNRNTKNDFVHNLLKSYYSKSTPLSPVSTIGNGSLVVYTNKKFIVVKIIIDYVRQPRPVNLSLNHGIELHEDTHDRICDIAVEILKKQIEDDSLQVEVQHNQLRN